MSRYAADEARLVYVGNLPEDVRDRDLDDLFAKYGRIRSVDIKHPQRPPPFAFVEFDDPRDAEDAIRGRDNYDFYGHRLRVELAKGSRTRGGRGEGNTREFRPPNTGYRVVVKGLPPSASWQDLKDFLRQAVRPAYTNVVRDRDGLMGVAEFESFDDMDRAIRKLDDTEFRNPYGHAYVRIYEDSSRGRGGGGRDRSRSRDRGRGRSPRRGRSTSRSRSRSPARGRSPPRRSPSPSRSRGRSPSRDGSPMEDRRRSPSPPAGDKYENAGDDGRDNEAELEERRDEEAAPVDE